MAVEQLIASLSSPTSGAFTFSGLDLSGFQRVMLRLDEMQTASGNTPGALRLETNNVLRTANYRIARLAYASSGNTSGSEASESTDKIQCIAGADSNWNITTGTGRIGSATIEIGGIGSGFNKLVVFRTAVQGATNSLLHHYGAGSLDETNELTGLSFYGVSNNIATGRASLWGYPI